jgi:putative ABC transport system permease protein
MKLLLTMAWRNLWRNRRRSLITISSVMFAVLLAIVFDSMERGSYERMIDIMVRYSTGYIQVQDVMFEEEPSIDNSLLFDEQIHDLLDRNNDRIAYYVPRIQSFALAATDEQTRGAMILGIDPQRENLLNDLSDDIISGEFLQQADQDILISAGLARIMNLSPGDSLVLLGQGFHGATAAGIYRIRGIAELAIPEMNNNTIYMSLETARYFYMAEDRVTNLIIMPQDPRQTQALALKLKADADPEWHRVLIWEEMLSDLLALMEFDMAGTYMMMGILYVVIAFGLFGTILTMMVERQREFAMVFSLGMKRGQLAVVCFLETLFISFSGVIAGMLLAFPLIQYFYHNPIRISGDMATAFEGYGFEPILPFSTDPVSFSSQAQVVLVIAIIVGLYPVYRVFRLNIMDAKK